jgi:hypothetical protein
MNSNNITVKVIHLVSYNNIMLGNYLLPDMYLIHTTFQKLASPQSLGTFGFHYTKNCFNFEMNGIEYMSNC